MIERGSVQNRENGLDRQIKIKCRGTSISSHVSAQHQSPRPRGIGGSGVSPAGTRKE